MSDKTLTKENVLNLAVEISTIKSVIDLQTHYIDSVPYPGKIKKDDIYFRYIVLYRALDSFFEINQDLTRKLDEVAGGLYDIVDELEEKKEKQLVK